MQRVEIYTDGACSGNPGKGGWGVVLRCKDKEKELSGYEDLTTNNRMELTAVIKALQALKCPCNITIYSDSKYVMDGITSWIAKWKQNGWKTANKKSAVKNVDLWQEIDRLAQAHEIRWVWVKGHDGNIDNERADELARRAIKNELDAMKNC
ncbi:MAG: ribonuclease HI [Alphaproteobacteria bacterium]|nr:ribonuclease HI [Alphaproteobacteria bacterium]